MTVKRAVKAKGARRPIARSSPLPQLALPHERDETSGTVAPRQPDINQAHRDLDAGMEDTDCYTRLSTLVPRLPGEK